MTVALIAALASRLVVSGRALGAVVAVLAAAGAMAGWWLSGIFVVSGVENLVAGGLGQSSINLLAVITPTGWSSFLPELPLGAEGQAWEGFHYLGLGIPL